MDKVRMGIIGIGNMGSDHARSICAGKVPDMVLAAVCDTNPGRLAWARENLPESVRTFEDAGEMLKSGLIDGVIVATPHYDHTRLCQMALELGIHAMSEKPAGVYTRQVRELIEKLPGYTATYAIMFNQRTNSVFRAMHDIVKSGELGEIRRTNWLITNWYRSQSYYDSGAWRATWAGEGGGVLLNQCPHNLDLWQWIVGMMPSRVRAFCHNGKWHDIEVEDDVSAYVEYPNGATGVFITSTGDTPGTNRFEILMDGGKLVYENDQLVKYVLEIPEPEFTRTYTGGFGEPQYTRTVVETSGENPQHIGVLACFAGHILRGEPLVAEGPEGIRGLTLSNAMHLSSWLNRMVELPLDEDLFISELQKRASASRHKAGSGRTLSTQGTY